MDLTNPIYTDADKARTHLESIRWPRGPVCPHCGSESKEHYALKGKTTRAGLYKCRDCLEPFTVTVGTVFERSKVPLNKWVLCAHLMAASKKGYSSHQMHRTLGVTYKTAWFMEHRLREAMKDNGGGFSGGGTVEADETYVGGKESNKHVSKRQKRTGGVGKQMVFSLVERGGNVRSFHLPSVNATNLRPVLRSQLNPAETRLMTDGEGQYRILAPMFRSHESVNHGANEYVRGDAHTNTVEGYFSIFKRGLIGTFHHVSPQHLQRYATEFDFRYNHRETRTKIGDKWIRGGFTDAERAAVMLKGIAGKRLTYY